MLIKYEFKKIRVMSNNVLENEDLNFIMNVDKCYNDIESEIIILRSKIYKNNEICKLLNLQLNLLSEIYILLSNKNIIFKIELI